MRENYTTLRCRGIFDAREFLHQVRVRQSMETVALNALGVEATRNREQLCHPWHGLVKCRIETGNMNPVWAALSERLDQLDFAGQMVWVVRSDAVQFIQQLLSNNLRLNVFHSMDYP